MPVRKYPKSINVDPNVRVLRIYPTEGTKKRTSELQTVGMKLSRDQAIHLARVLLFVSQEWEEIDITGWRLKRRHSDGTYRVTVTSSVEEYILKRV